MLRNAFARNSAKDDNNKKLLTASALSSRDATDVIEPIMKNTHTVAERGKPTRSQSIIKHGTNPEDKKYLRVLWHKLVNSETVFTIL